MGVKKNGFSFSKSFVIAVAIVLLLVLAGFIGWNLFKYKFIKDRVKLAVYEKTNGLYTIRYDKMDLDEAGGYLHMTNLHIFPDTAQFRQMMRDKKNPALVMELIVPELTVYGVKTPAALINKKINGRRLEIKNASVVFYFAKVAADTADAAPKEEIYRQLLGNLNEIQADSVEVTEVALSFVNMLNGRKTITANGISVHLQDVLIDSLHSDDSSRFFFAKRIQIKGDTALVKNRQGNYFYHFYDFAYNSNGGLFSIKNLQIVPQQSESKFADDDGIQKDRFNVDLKNVSVKHIDLSRLTQNYLVADSLVIGKMMLKVFRDRSYPGDKLNRVGQFPQQLLMKIPLLTTINKLIVRDAFIEYKEKNPKSDYSGKIQFEHANAVVSNISNDPLRIKANNQCRLGFNASFLGMVPMHAAITMFLGNPQGRFLFSGSMKSFDARKLNELIAPMGLASIEKGQVNSVQFNFSGHNYGSNGKLTILYEDLKLSLLKKDTATNQLEKKKLASFVANLVVKNANPLRKQPVRVAEVQYVRDTNKSFFNLMWKSVFAGVKQSAGM